MKIFAIRVVSILIIFTATFAHANEYFKKASTLAGLSSSIAQVAGNYNRELTGNEDIPYMIKYSLLTSIAETATTCALLTGNIIGAAGMMDANARRSYNKMINNSIENCNDFVTFRTPELEVLASEKSSMLLSNFATDLIKQLSKLDSELAL